MAPFVFFTRINKHSYMHCCRAPPFPSYAGAIPKELGKLTALEELDLSHNKIEGETKRRHLHSGFDVFGF